MFVKKRLAFSLVELLVVMVILSIFATVGARFLAFNEDAQKFRKTMEKMITIRRAIIGDERLHQCGMRVEFGYVERIGTFPIVTGSAVPVDLLEDYLPPLPAATSVTHADAYLNDEWGNALVCTASINLDIGTGAQDYFEILSLGKDNAVGNAGNVPFGDDFHILIRRDLYLNPRIELNVSDMNGTILRGYDAATGIRHQIARVWVRNSSNANSFDTDDATLTYANGAFTAQNVPVGLYYAYVYPTAGTGAGQQGLFDHRDDLSGNVGRAVYFFIIYPKDPDVPNFVELRMPGAVAISEF